jgi:hypothetical protein
LLVEPELPELPEPTLPVLPVLGVEVVFFAAFFSGFAVFSTFLAAFFGAGLEDVLVCLVVLDVLFIECILKLTF